MEENVFQVPDAMTQETRTRTHTSSLAARRFGYVVAIIANMVVLWVFRRLDVWGAPFITSAWSQVLPFIETSIYGTIAAQLVYLFYDARWFRRLGQIGLNVLSLRVLGSLYRVYPFDFAGSHVDGWVRIGLIVAMVGVAIGMLVEAIGLLSGRE